MATPKVRLAMVTLDCADPGPVSRFWSELLGWDRIHSGDDYAMLQAPANAIGFGRVEDYQPPQWPNAGGSKQFHFDLATDDIEATAKRCVELGATQPDEQPGQTWRVLLDRSRRTPVLPDRRSELVSHKAGANRRHQP